MKNWSEKSWGLLVMIIVSLLIIIHASSCGVLPKSTPNCKLMDLGQRCVPDHSCCKW